MTGKEPHSIGNGKATAETAKALLVQLEDEVDAFGNPVEIWIPKSVIHDDSEVFAEDGEGEIIVHKWWAEKNDRA